MEIAAPVGQSAGMFALVLQLLFTLADQPAMPRLVAVNLPVRDQLGGGSRAFDIDSTVLGQKRRVLVHLPPSFEKSAPSRRYPTIVVFDGEWMLRPVVVTSDVLTSLGQMPESVIVSIENTDDYDGRVHDLTPPGLAVSGSGRNEGGDRFLDFIEKELLPALDAQFRAAAPRVVVGTSSGGILATYAAATRETFRLALALDTPIHLGDQWLAGKMMQRAAEKNRAPVRYASYDVRFGWNEDRWNKLVAAAPSSWLLHREKLTRENHTSMQFLGSYLGLRELFRDYSVLAAPQVPTTSTLPYYEKLAAAYGAPMVPPATLLRQVVDDLLMEGRGAAAHAALDSYVAAYGEPSDIAKLRTDVADVERRPPPTETVEGLLATPFPTVEEARDYLGVWEGHQWINVEDKHRLQLRLVAKGDRVEGTIVSWPEKDLELPQELQYLKVTPDGLDFGLMNGMRPRGVIVHEGKRSGDVLAGESHFRGINFVWPEGMTPPKHEFTLRKVAK